MDHVYSTPKPGDWAVTQIEGPVGAAIRIGQWMIGADKQSLIPPIFVKKHKYQHAFVYVGDLCGDPRMIVEAEPGGARVSKLSEYENALFGEHPQYTISWFETPASVAERVADEALNLLTTPYSFLDYAAIATHRFHLSKAEALRKYVADTGHMICSQLVDEACRRAGLQLFDDSRWPGYVTPMDLWELIRAQEMRRAGFDITKGSDEEVAVIHIRELLANGGQDLPPMVSSDGTVISYPICCPYCLSILSSQDSYERTRAHLRDHISLKHVGKPNV